MDRLENARKSVLKASRSYYAHLGYYEEYTYAENTNRRELDFFEFAFRTHATLKVRDVLDVACGSGRHVLGLAHRGYKCTGQDYTPEQVQIAKTRAKQERVSMKLLQGDATKLKYESEFDAVLAVRILFLLPDDESVLTCLRQVHRALKSDGILICNIANPFYDGENWFSLKSIQRGHYFNEVCVPKMRFISVDRIQDFDPIRGVAWWQETHIVETPEGIHVFQEHERLRLFTYWDMLHYLQAVGFKEIKCYPDWKINSGKKPKAEWLVFVSRKD
ncbi:MAG TPA: class I SAM-dependent methyltransferase [Candidatus Bathyarchaeia archaeon]|nr:class I SAM-dependent methyltransferase [Candidatus Bathyarchaeia archaeon]